MQSQLFLAFERFHAHRAHKRTLWIVGLLVPCQMILALQCRITNVTNESSFQIMSNQMLFEKSSLCNLMLRIQNWFSILNGKAHFCTEMLNHYLGKPYDILGSHTKCCRRVQLLFGFRLASAEPFSPLEASSSSFSLLPLMLLPKMYCCHSIHCHSFHSIHLNCLLALDYHCLPATIVSNYYFRNLIHCCAIVVVHFVMFEEWNDAVAVIVFAWVAYGFVGFDSKLLHSITDLNSTNSIPNPVPNFGCVPYQYSVNDNNFNQILNFIRLSFFAFRFFYFCFFVTYRKLILWFFFYAFRRIFKKVMQWQAGR